MPFLGLYVAAKFAVEGLTESYHYELKPTGVDCVIVDPGVYPGTKFKQNAKMGKDQSRLTDFEDLKKLNDKMLSSFEAKAKEPQEIADAILKLEICNKGIRPLMTTKGLMSEYANKINSECAEVQKKLFKTIGLGSIY